MNLEKEDYVDPHCVLCGKPGEVQPTEPVPMDRILDRLRIYEDANDWEKAERHLLYWLAEAEQNGDLRGRLMLNNELMGFYRKQGDREKAIAHAEKAESLVTVLGMEETVTAGTTWVNIGTVREAFGDPAAGLTFFRKARVNYERLLPREDSRLAGLYNNMALALTAVGDYEEAGKLFRVALDVLERQGNGQLEQAITWLNMADALCAADGAEGGEGTTEETIEEYLSRAMSLLDTPEIPRNGYYAFVCEKCAPVFGHYGYFLQEAELNRRVCEIRG